MIENLNQIPGRQLAKREAFRFACRPDLDCFNSCCRDKRLPLWPYDLLRLRLALETSSPEILERYVELEFDPASGWPALRLRLDEQGRCPFVSPQGCQVYKHRPGACRIYPLARATAAGSDEAIYILQETKNCLGWDQDRKHTSESWTQDQELAEYDRANDLMRPLFFHEKRRGRVELEPIQVHVIIAALYNLDVFRQMIERPDFKAGRDPARIEEALTDDLELLLLGRDFLIERLFG